MSDFKKILYLDEDGDVTHTKLWSNIGYLLMSLSFISITILLVFDIITFTNWLYSFWSLGILVAIPRGFSKFMKYMGKNSILKLKGLEMGKDARSNV